MSGEDFNRYLLHDGLIDVYKLREREGILDKDANGIASVPLAKAGPYVIRMTHMEWVKRQTHEWESYWATITFEVLSD